MAAGSRTFLLATLLVSSTATGVCMPPPDGSAEPSRSPRAGAAQPTADAPSHLQDEEPASPPDVATEATAAAQDEPPARAGLAPAPPPSADEIAELLAKGRSALRDAGVKRTPSTALPKKHRRYAELRSAYSEGRALAYRGRLQQVRTWMALAKFGAADPGGEATDGPLARYELVVTTQEEQAWLHVVVPVEGLAAQGSRGKHYSLHGDDRWVLLSDHLEVGVDYLPFKREAPPSLHRQWGRESVIADLSKLAKAYSNKVDVLLGVGDISEVTGGRIKDHWTHRLGVDADLYLLRYDGGPAAATKSKGGPDPKPICMWHTYRRNSSIWSTSADGKRGVESRPDSGADTLTARRLRALAELVLEDDDIAFFVHNDPEVLDEFDHRAGERRPGRRFLHAKNRGYWPEHRDHVHLRWVDGPLPVGVAPRP